MSWLRPAYLLMRERVDLKVGEYIESIFDVSIKREV